MEVVNISKRKYASLQPLVLPKNVSNTEAQMYILPAKNKWRRSEFVLKRLYQDTGEVFGNKLYTVSTLLDLKSQIAIDELVMPSSIAALNNELIGFTMPFIPSMNLQVVLTSPEFSIEQKVGYLKEVGQILEKMKQVRAHTEITNFYLNDIHENNFILNLETGHINAVDLDSSKIRNNLASAARYLTPLSKIAEVGKYIKEENAIGGCYKIDENTELYCYIMIILKCFYREAIQRVSIEEYFIYLDYLTKIGVPRKIVDIFSYVYTGHNNENPYEELEELIPFYGKMNHYTYEANRKRMK